MSENREAFRARGANVHVNDSDSLSVLSVAGGSVGRSLEHALRWAAVSGRREWGALAVDSVSAVEGAGELIGERSGATVGVGATLDTRSDSKLVHKVNIGNRNSLVKASAQITYSRSAFYINCAVISFIIYCKYFAILKSCFEVFKNYWDFVSYAADSNGSSFA